MVLRAILHGRETPLGKLRFTTVLGELGARRPNMNVSSALLSKEETGLVSMEPVAKRYGTMYLLAEAATWTTMGIMTRPFMARVLHVGANSSSATASHPIQERLRFVWLHAPEARINLHGVFKRHEPTATAVHARTANGLWPRHTLFRVNLHVGPVAHPYLVQYGSKH